MRISYFHFLMLNEYVEPRTWQPRHASKIFRYTEVYPIYIDEIQQRSNSTVSAGSASILIKNLAWEFPQKINYKLNFMLTFTFHVNYHNWRFTCGVSLPDINNSVVTIPGCTSIMEIVTLLFFIFPKRYRINIKCLHDKH